MTDLDEREVEINSQMQGLDEEIACTEDVMGIDALFLRVSCFEGVERISLIDFL